MVLFFLLFCWISLTDGFQIRFDDPGSEWETVNAWFVKQNNFVTRFDLRDIVMPEKGVSVGEN